MLLQRRQEKLNDQFTKIFSVRKQMTRESLVSKIQEIVPWWETFKIKKFVFAFFLLSVVKIFPDWKMSLFDPKD